MNCLAKAIVSIFAQIVGVPSAIAQVSFEILPRTNPHRVAGAGLRLLDFDRDAHPELVAPGSGSYWEYLGSGQYTDVEQLLFPFRCFGAAHSFASGDVNHDGHTDHMIFRRGSPPCAPHLIMGNSTFTFTDEAAIRLPSGLGVHSNCQFLDVDGDGDLDAVLGGIGGVSSYEVLINDGLGYFTRDSARAFGHNSLQVDTLRFMQPADLDNDGDMDLVLGIIGDDGFGVSPPFASQIYHNDGNGHFTLAQHFVPDYHLWFLHIGDVDGDGYVDLLKFGLSSPFGVASNPVLMMNDGFGRFFRDNSRLPPLSGEQLGAVGDFDADGDLDIVVSRVAAVPLATGEFDVYAQWVNDGLGNFTEVSPSPMPRTTLSRYVPGAMSCGDLDDDGDIDVLGGGTWPPSIPPGPHILWNMKRHLYAPAEARLGQDYDVELTADAGHIVGLMLSFRSGWYDLGTLGRLRIDPSIAFAIPSYVMPATRKVTFTLPISTDPALLGLELHWQGLDIDPIRPELSRLTGVYHDVVQQ